MVVSIILIILILIFILDYLRNNNKRISEVIVATGITIMLSSFIDLNQLFFLLLSHLNNEKINYLEYAKADISYINICIGLFIIIIGIFLDKIKEIDLLNIFTFSDKRPKINDFNNVRENKLDIISLYSVLNDNGGENCRLFFEEFDRKLGTYNLEHKYSKNAYTGIVSIPLALYAGTKLKEIDFKAYYEYNKKTKKYEKLRKKSTVPQINLEYTDESHKNETEIVLAFGITTKIKKEDLIRFQNINKRIYNINRREETRDNEVKSILQLKMYTMKLYDIFYEILKLYPKLKKIHLIISSQSCLVVELGKLIDDRNLPEIISYQFVYGDIMKYPWGLIINGKEAGKYVGKK